MLFRVGLNRLQSSTAEAGGGDSDRRCAVVVDLDCGLLWGWWMGMEPNTIDPTYLRVEGQCSSGSKKMRRVMASSEYVEAKCGPHRENR